VGRAGPGVNRPALFATIDRGKSITGRIKMDNDRIIDLGEDLRNHVFETLDAEIELTGEDAGKVAKAVEDAFVKALQAVNDDVGPFGIPKGWDRI